MYAQSMARLLLKVTIGVLLVGGLVLTGTASERVARATGGWTEGELFSQYSKVPKLATSLYSDNCEFQFIKAFNKAADYYCIIQETGVSFGYNMYGDTVVKKRYDSTYYPLEAADNYVHVSGGDKALGYRNLPGNQVLLSVYSSVSERLHFQNGKYVFSTDNPVFQSSPQSPWAAISSLSKNGKYITLMTPDYSNSRIYVSKIDTTTSHIANIGTVSVSELVTYGMPMASISEDGRYVATVVKVAGMSSLHTVKIWDTSNCNITETGWCDNRVASAGKSTSELPKIATPISLSFNDASDQLIVSSWDESMEAYRTVFSPDQLFSTSRVEYLALGDSFTSGEGAGVGKYLAHTDESGNALLGIPREKCHLASSSYPFLLAHATMKNGSMISVACSGAEVAKDYLGNNKDYLGQRDRLKELSLFRRSDLKEEALDISHIPGRNKQIEFVKRYKPRAITVMGGGNDVGFANILQLCATPGICSQVADKSKIRDQVTSIQTQYSILMSLYTELHRVSPLTKIYVVGYPQFVSNKPDPCAVDQGLNLTERRFIRHGVSYMNEVIHAAASTVGVTYLDIENSLEGNNLCSHGKIPLLGVVNGIKALFDWWGVDISNPEDTLAGFIDPGSYHPNALGHIRMQKSITAQLGGKSLVEFEHCWDDRVLCPTMAAVEKVPFPAYFDLGSSSAIPSRNTKILASQNIQKGSNNTIHIQVDGAASGMATVRIASTPMTLGTVQVDSDGVIDQEYAIPENLEAGYHTVYVDMQTPAGEPLTLYEQLLVLGKEGDIDENGIVDLEQKCPFVVPGKKDEFGRLVDEYCMAADSIGVESDDIDPSESTPPVIAKVSSLEYKTANLAPPAISPAMAALGMKQIPPVVSNSAQDIEFSQHSPTRVTSTDEVARSARQRSLGGRTFPYTVLVVILFTVILATGIYYVKNKKNS